MTKKTMGQYLLKIVAVAYFLAAKTAWDLNAFRDCSLLQDCWGYSGATFAYGFAWIMIILVPTLWLIGASYED